MQILIPNNRKHFQKKCPMLLAVAYGLRQNSIPDRKLPQAATRTSKPHPQAVYMEALPPKL